VIYEGIEASRHRGIKQRSREEEKKRKHPQITQITQIREEGIEAILF